MTYGQTWRGGSPERVLHRRHRNMRLLSAELRQPQALSLRARWRHHSDRAMALRPTTRRRQPQSPRRQVAFATQSRTELNRSSPGAKTGRALAVTRGRLKAMPTLLNDMPLARAGRVFLHPIHQEVFPALVQFIVDLRHCQTTRTTTASSKNCLTRSWRCRGTVQRAVGSLDDCGLAGPCLGTLPNCGQART